MPEKKGKARRQTTSDDEPKLSRLKSMIDRGVEIHMPETSGCEHLLAYLFEVGPCMSGAMGRIPLNHQEIAAWQSNLGICLQPWEVRAVMRLSQEYTAMSHEATDPACPIPWIMPVELRPVVTRPVREVAEPPPTRRKRKQVQE